MKKYIIIILLISTYNNCFCQNRQEVKVGDRVPNITIQHFFDDSARSVKISEMYEHKLLILDFWATWCGSCLDEMMEFPKLKKEFGDRLNIIAVGYESRERIASLFKRNPSLHNPQWATLYSDSLMTKNLFPHHTLPHLVWIDSTGKVITITEGYELTSANIKKVFDGQPVTARIKIDNENSSVSVIFKPFHQMDSDFIARSIFTRRMKGGGLAFTSIQPYSEGKQPIFNRIYAGNNVLYNLYWFAAFPLGSCDANKGRLIFELNDSLRFTSPNDAPESFKKSQYKSYPAWADSNLYCYDAIVPKELPDSVLRANMLYDLNRYLNLNGRWENREMLCYAIRDQRDASKDAVVGTAETKTIYYNSKLETITILELIKLLNKRIVSGYVLNESSTNMNKIFNMNISIQPGIKPNEISSVLKTIGLKLVAVKRKAPVYVVSE